ncbi:MAG: 16S rRNA (cytosine(1402)-N(4))-methyltransferase RsmH [Patescibacteria group bacterium]|nr:16S rRNA (cytosine(1402)-N(4))-methyltransferase RsmH [Patescibacteria group bacterium]
MRTRRSRSSGNPVSPSEEIRGHTPVLLHEALQALDIRPDDTVVDATLGGAGHARAIAERLGKAGTLIGMDLDADAIERGRAALADSKAKIHLVQANFRHIAPELKKLGIASVTKVLFDLGWSAYQLDSRLPAEASAQAGRGFSFTSDGPLLMTYAKDPAPDAITASTIVNEWGESSIADVIYGWGGERYARRIARAIVERRQKQPINTPAELAEIVRSGVPARARHGRVHPATKTFQALRIAVNDELTALSEGLAGAWSVLAPGGRIAVIAFHSLEDRLVKQAFVQLEKSEGGRRITRKPITPERGEVLGNPRSRSAKLRVIKKIPTLA